MVAPSPGVNQVARALFYVSAVRSAGKASICMPFKVSGWHTFSQVAQLGIVSESESDLCWLLNADNFIRGTSLLIFYACTYSIMINHHVYSLFFFFMLRSLFGYRLTIGS